jgi:hypothetical protein
MSGKDAIKNVDMVMGSDKQLDYVVIARNFKISLAAKALLMKVPTGLAVGARVRSFWTNDPSAKFSVDLMKVVTMPQQQGLVESWPGLPFYKVDTVRASFEVVTGFDLTSGTPQVLLTAIKGLKMLEVFAEQITGQIKKEHLVISPDVLADWMGHFLFSTAWFDGFKDEELEAMGGVADTTAFHNVNLVTKKHTEHPEFVTIKQMLEAASGGGHPLGHPHDKKPKATAGGTAKLLTFPLPEPTDSEKALAALGAEPKVTNGDPYHTDDDDDDPDAA